MIPAARTFLAPPPAIVAGGGAGTGWWPGSAIAVYDDSTLPAGGAVGAWANAVGTGPGALTEATSRPHADGTQNSRRVATFDGVNDQLAVADATSFNDATIFLLIRLTDINTAGQWLGFVDTQTGASQYGLLYRRGDNNKAHQWGPVDAATTHDLFDGWRAVGIVLRSGVRTGLLIGTEDFTAPTTTTFTANGLAFIANNNTRGAFQLACAVVKAGDARADMAAFRTAANSRWGVST